MLSNEYFLSLHLRNAGAKPLGANLRKFTNGTSEVTIEYLGKDGIFYQGVIQPNLLTFIFSEKSFKQIPKPTLAPLSPPQPPALETLNLKDPALAPRLTELDFILKIQDPQLGSAKTGTLATKADKSSTMVLVYAGKAAGEEYQVEAEFSKDGVLGVFTVKQTKSGSPVSVQTNDSLGANDKNVSPPGLIYKAFSPESDPYYVIVSDFVSVQLPRYKGLKPTSSESSTKDNFIYYRFSFSLPDGSEW